MGACFLQSAQEGEGPSAAVALVAQDSQPAAAVARRSPVRSVGKGCCSAAAAVASVVPVGGEGGGYEGSGSKREGVGMEVTTHNNQTRTHVGGAREAAKM